ncbi:MAG: septation protein SepH [Mycobacterium sp.]|nr:septation protein SepH [Mycobacterium sp.]
MRELKMVGLDPDGRYVICEGHDPAERFKLAADDRLREALRDQKAPQPQRDFEVAHVLSPKEIQAKIRAGASVEQVAAAAGADIARVRRFAHPVLLERARAAELATAAHPVLADGPAVLTLLETVSAALVTRGVDPDRVGWDAWRNEDSRWTVQLAWKMGHSDNVAHFCFAPGAHGGTVTAVDDTAHERVAPNYEPRLRPLARVTHLEFEETETPANLAPPEQPTGGTPPEKPAPTRRSRPVVPAWEDVLLGVRSNAQR